MTDVYSGGVMYEVLRQALKDCEKRWGSRPHAVLACAGFADEHWQIYNSDELIGYIQEPDNKGGWKKITDGEPVMPRYIITLDGVLSAHPDSAGK